MEDLIFILNFTGVFGLCLFEHFTPPKFIISFCKSITVGCLLLVCQLPINIECSRQRSKSLNINIIYSLGRSRIQLLFTFLWTSRHMNLIQMLLIQASKTFRGSDSWWKTRVSVPWMAVWRWRQMCQDSSGWFLILWPVIWSTRYLDMRYWTDYWFSIYIG